MNQVPIIKGNFVSSILIIPNNFFGDLKDEKGLIGMLRGSNSYPRLLRPCMDHVPHWYRPRIVFEGHQTYKIVSFNFPDEPANIGFQGFEPIMLLLTSKIDGLISKPFPGHISGDFGYLHYKSLNLTFLE